MAERVSDELVEHLAIASRSTYDWDQYADGGWWHLKEGKDYTAATPGVRASAKRWGDKEGRDVQTRPTKEGFLLRIK